MCIRDSIYVTAPVTVLSYLMKRLGITQKKIRHAMLIGGGRVSYYLAQMLIGADVHVKIIENNPQRSEQLAQMLPEAAIICADGANQEILEAEGLNETDALVTLTGIDEQNIITSMVGNAKGVPHIVTKVNRIMTTGMVETLPIGSVVSPKELCSANIVQYVRAMQHQTGAAVTLHRIADGRAEALEFIVNKQSKYIGEPLKNLRLTDQKPKEKKKAAGGHRTVTKKMDSAPARNEVDVRGMNLEEALMEVDAFIDHALMHNLNMLTIIHGKGTGILRNGIQQHLRRHKAVKSFRLGVYGEGESGVTIVELK